MSNPSSDMPSACQPSGADWQVILLVGGQPDDPTILELREGLAEESIIDCRHLPLAELEAQSDRLLPDLILLMADGLAQDNMDVASLCGELREELQTYRPVIVVYGNIDEATRIACLTEGADDALSGDLSLSELKVRLLIQLRRNLEVTAHPVTKLPGLALTGKLLQRRMNREESWAFLLISLDHFHPYQEIYGQLPANQVLRSFVAMLARSVLIPDFIGQTEGNDFLVLTHPDKAIKIATMLCRQFEAAMPNFYSERDKKQGYMISIPAENVSYRIPLLSLSVGIVTHRTITQPAFMGAYSVAVTMRNLARRSPGSTWMMDTPQIAGEQACQASSCDQQNILVVESDAAMAFLLKTTLQMDGYHVDTVSSAKEAKTLLDQAARTGIRFCMVILDALLQGDVYLEGNPEQSVLSGLELCREIRSRCPEMAMVCTSTLHQRELVLRAGADLYLPKPFEMGALFTWVERLMSGQR